MSADHFTPAERRATLVALLVVLLLSSLDTTVVGPAMPRIIAELHGLSLISWVSTAYMLTSTILAPIYGKLATFMVEVDPDFWRPDFPVWPHAVWFSGGVWRSAAAGQRHDAADRFPGDPGRWRRGALHDDLHHHRRPVSTARTRQIHGTVRRGLWRLDALGPPIGGFRPIMAR